VERRLSFFKDYLAAYFRRRSPSYFIFFITSRCNSRCEICFFWEQLRKGYQSKELTLDEIEKLTAKSTDILHLLLSGGEPFLREDISEIVRCFVLNTNTRLVSVPTNASLPEKIERQVEKILTDNPYIHLNVNLSLDGVGREHDELRGHTGCYEKLVETYQKLKVLQKRFPNIGVNIQTVFTKKNHEKMEELAFHVYKEFDVGFHGFSIVRGNPQDWDIKDVSFERAVQIHNIMGEYALRRESSLPFRKSINPILNLMGEYCLKTLKDKERSFPCLAGGKLAVLSDDGSLWPCEPFWLEPDTRHGKSPANLCFGNVRDFDYDLPSMLKTPKAKDIRRHVAQKKCCCLWDCAYFCGILYSPRAQLSLLRKFLNPKKYAKTGL